jgi:uncharacterized protein
MSDETSGLKASKLDANLAIDRAAIAAFCRRHHIRWLAVFGSALRDDFGPESDVDVLVEFEPGKTPGFVRFAGIERDLSDILGRPVDLLTREGLNRRIAPRILAGAAVMYDAA